MKKSKLIITVFAIFAVLLWSGFVLSPISWDVPSEFKNMKNPVKKTDKALAEGKLKYNHNCAGCHGFTGKGDGEKIKNLANIKPANLILDPSNKQTDGERFYKIKYGRGGNHSFSGKLDDECIWIIVNYLSTFEGK